jgi:hypothetical protein
MSNSNALIPALAGLILGIALLLLAKYTVYRRKKELAEQGK